MQLFISSNCSGTATATGRHRTINDEDGHAIGLGHIDRNASGQVITGECPGYSVMQANPPMDQTCWHDRDELRWNMYIGHWEG